MAEKSTRLTFPGDHGADLAARLDMPPGPVQAYALFAHCFTCSKDLKAARRVAEGLAAKGIAVLRFDFTGLGSSEGEFASTNFSSNVGDVVRAADYLRDNYRAPTMLVGHSLGGAAVLAAAGRIPEVKAVATIGAPCDTTHLIKIFGEHLNEIEAEGEAEVNLAGRNFTIRKQFLEDLRDQTQESAISGLGKALMVMHSPVDEIVGIENAAHIFQAAKHPKSFISLHQADHLLSRPEDAAYVAEVIAAWSTLFLDPVKSETPEKEERERTVRVSETGEGKYQNRVNAGPHHFLADEPASVGGKDTGPSPYDFLSTALAACTSMTLRIYAGFKKLELGRVSVEVRHGKVPADHCRDCGEIAEGRTGKIDRFERLISVEGGVSPELEKKLLEIADKCPVHGTLKNASAVVTSMVAAEDQ